MAVNTLLLASLLLSVIILIYIFLLFRRNSGGGDSTQLSHRLETLDQGLSQKFTDLAVRLENTRGELNLAISNQLADGLKNVRVAVDSQLTQGRSEQSITLAQVTSTLEQKLEQLTLRQSQSAQESRNELSKSLEAIR